MARRQSFTAALAANGSTTPIEWPGGDGTLIASGTFGGGTLSLELQGPGGAWMKITNLATTTQIALTAAGMAQFRLPNGPCRATLTGATGPTISTCLVGIPSNEAG